MTGSKKGTARATARRKSARPGSSGPPARAEAPSEDPVVLRQQAEEQVRRNAETIRSVPIATATEPAFVFKP